MNTPMMTCREFQALLPDYLDAHALSSARRAAADAHITSCVECAALVTDLRTIVRDAAELPARRPSRDLWGGIESRIEAPVVELPVGKTADDGRPAADGGRQTAVDGRPTAARLLHVWRLGIAASLLVAATAGITYTLTRSAGEASSLAAGSDSSSQSVVRRPSSVVSPASNVTRPSAEETFDREIAVLRRIVDVRRTELDTSTVAVLEKNLKLIDDAIAACKAALAADPASAFLLERLTRAYESKLHLLRGAATLPSRT